MQGYFWQDLSSVFLFCFVLFLTGLEPGRMGWGGADVLLPLRQEEKV